MRRTDRFLSLVARLRERRIAALPLVGLLAAVGPLALTSGSVQGAVAPAEVAYRSLPDLPTGSADVEASATALAASLGAVPLDALGAECAVDDLTVSWGDPGDRYSIGAHVTPIGPAPDDTTTSVNGIVVCSGSTYAYMGFEARLEDDGRWDVIDVPYVGHEEDEGQLVAQPAPVIPQGPKPVPVLAAPGTVTGPIEGYAAYEPQRTCDPTPKVGTRSLAGALLRDYAGSRNLGIVRGCSVGGRSEHKEGRAFDWGVNISNPNEKAATDAFIGALMATDSAGNRHALARRMGVMYLISDRQIWSAYRASEGWRPYSGSSPHRDHVHISLSWAGANGRTSFWSGTVPPDLPTASPVTANVVSSRRSSGSRDTTSSSSRGWGGSRHHDDGDDDDDEWSSSSAHLSREQLADGIRALWHDGHAPTAAEIEAWLVSVGVSADKASAYADWAVERAGHGADTSSPTTTTGGDWHRDEWDDDDWDDHDDWRADQEAEREAREDEWERQRAEWAEELQRREDEAEQQREDQEADWRDDHDGGDDEWDDDDEWDADGDHDDEWDDDDGDHEDEWDHDDDGDDGSWDHGNGGNHGRGPWPSPTTTVPNPTTTTPPTTTTVPPPTTTVAPTTTSTTSVDATTTTAGG